MIYLVVIEQGDESLGAYVPDLPGCAAVGGTREEALRLVREAVAMHIEGLREQGLPPRSEGLWTRAYAEELPPTLFWE